MDIILHGGIPFLTLLLLAAAVLLALGFEFVNGFHDTANAVATVIYTRALTPTKAVLMSGFFNFLGVIISGGAVAFGILALLPVELIVNVGSGAGFAMVFALLLSAILWNLGTWYFGLPASSSHSLIGAIVGVGLMNSYLAPERAFGDGVNWGKVEDTVIALVVSPLVGFGLSWLLMVIAKATIKSPELFQEPPKDKAPPIAVRALLWFTCGFVSFSHGSNDGQKGMGLMMLILIGVVPAGFALDNDVTSETLATLSKQSVVASDVFHGLAGSATVSADGAPALLSAYLRTGKVDPTVYAGIAVESKAVAAAVAGKNSLNDIPAAERPALRKEIYLVSESITKLGKTADGLPAANKDDLKAYAKKLNSFTNFIPMWVKLAVAFALGLGTMVGWKRIVVTVGEKIGKAHLTYAQGASAELVAGATIAAASVWGLPVSTTHVLSSGVAGTMYAAKAGLQMETLRNLLLAWVLTLPVCVFMGALLFAAGLYGVGHLFGG